VYKRLEEVVARCVYMEWKHFDAGVVKVGGRRVLVGGCQLQQLSLMG
jgi:hypothetical protein